MLAVTGCLVIQCLIATWILLSKAQIELVLLQVRTLHRVYRLDTEGATATRHVRPAHTAGK